MTTRAAEPDVAEAWRLVDELRELTPEEEWPYRQRESQLLVAAVLARAGMADSARAVIARSRGDVEVDPERELLSYEAFVQILLGNPDRAIKLIETYLTANPEHREGLARHQAWWWRPLQDDPRFKALIAAGG